MSYQVIARKYRPQVFDEVVGQRLITETLKNAIRSDRVAHGYIFSGGRGVGKTSTARILAKCLNCVKGPTITPCGECPSCTEIAAGNSVDVLEIDAASNRGIDEIRELRETVRYLPARDRYKIFIIDEVHMLTTEAFNALLKTLEEPPPRSLFILATTEPHKLPTTIQSRCQHFSFRLLDYSEIYAQLARICAAEGVQADEKSLSAIAQAAEGSLRDSLSILDQVIAACGNQLVAERVRQLLGVVPASFMSELIGAIHAADGKAVLERVSKLADEGYDLGHFCGELTRYVRDLMIARTCGSESPLLQVPNDERGKLGELAGLFSEEDLSRFFQILLRTESDLRYSLEPRFHLELGLMKLAYTRRLASLESLLSELREMRSPSPSGPVRGPGPSRTAHPGRSTGDVIAPGSSKVDFRASPGAPSASTAALSQGATPRTGEAIKRPVSAPPLPGDDEDPFLEAAPLPEYPDEDEGIRPGPQVPTTSRETSGAPDAQAPGLAAADERVAAIKSLILSQSKWVSSCLNAALDWRFENGEVRLCYASKDAGVAGILKGREPLAKLRAACEQVLGRPVRICVTLQEDTGEALPRRRHVQERAGSDPAVETFRKKFDCTLVDLKDLSQEWET
jgi:DNA polymerase III subunit gamma/tau